MLIMLSNSATSPKTYWTRRAKKKWPPREQIDMDAMKPVWPPLPTLETTQKVALIKNGRKRVSNLYHVLTVP